MVMDFVDHHGANARTGVAGAQRVRDLRRELFIADTVDVATERHAVCRSPERESMRVASKVGLRVTGEEVNLLSPRAEGEAAIGAGCSVELRFVKNEKTARGDDRSIRNPEFLRH